MSLRTDYTGALDTKLAEAREAGRTFVVADNLAAISAALVAAANQGEKEFTFTQTLSYQPQDLRLLGPLWDAFKTGMYQGLAEEDLMQNEATISLNTSDQLSTKVDIKFSF